MWKYLEFERADIWQVMPNWLNRPTHHKYFPPQTQPNVNPSTARHALKTATKINIPEKIPSRVVISVFTFMHACTHTQWKIENGNYLHVRETRGKWNFIHCFRHPRTQHQLHVVSHLPMHSPGRKKYFKIICAVWFDDVSPANHLMIIYGHCRWICRNVVIQFRCFSVSWLESVCVILMLSGSHGRSEAIERRLKQYDWFKKRLFSVARSLFRTFNKHFTSRRERRLRTKQINTYFY